MQINSHARPLKHFHLFSQLPPELRLKVYLCIHNLTNPLNQILQITYSPSTNTYNSHTAPPLILSISHESRDLAFSVLGYRYLELGERRSKSWKPSIPLNERERDHGGWRSGSSIKPPKPKEGLIPIDYATTTLYLTSLSPILALYQQTILYHLSTSSSLARITSLALDLRSYSELSDSGLLSILCKMKSLREVLLVVEFGRSFEGEIGWLEAPEWRQDLRWVARTAEEEVRRGRERAGVGLNGVGKVGVRCVLLTRGGEQA